MKKNFLLSLIFVLCFNLNIYSQINYNEICITINNYLQTKNLTKLDTFVYIDVNLQKLFLLADTLVLRQYDISTSLSKASFCAEFNSNKTPLGLHIIESKIGDNLPPGNIVKMEKIIDSIGVIYKPGDFIPDNTEDIIMTRVLLLSGIEKGINKGKSEKGKIIDTFYRGIYIHGTNNKAEIGKANSHGCIRMNNIDITELYNLVKINTIILIL